MNGKVIVLGIGNKARQGKDTVAGFVKSLRKNVQILHFADALYEETENKDRVVPLIVQITAPSGHCYYHILDNASEKKCVILGATEVPYLHLLFQARKITQYWGMNEKDSPILQFWGTDFRRKQNPNYWVDKISEKIKRRMSVAHPDNAYFVVADTRFNNEVAALKNLGGTFVRVIRLNEDGSQFLDIYRDPQHASEIDLDNMKADTTITAKTGDLDSLRVQTEQMLNKLEGNNNVTESL